MENNSQAIELKGIVRNQTKIGVQDGQCDDIVNLRFKDGSWRVADDGKQVYQMPSNTTYSQLYVHTNVYHHLLGVSNDKLYWFANIEADGETFTNLDNPVEICDVQGDVTIVQNGHLLIIMSGNTLYAIFKEFNYEIINKTLANSLITDRANELLGALYFNVYSPKEPSNAIIEKTDKDAEGNAEFFVKCTRNENTLYFESGDSLTEKFMANFFNSRLNYLQEKNLLYKPFLVVGAVKLYDGSWVAATTPVYIFPDEAHLAMKNIVLEDNSSHEPNSSYLRQMCYPTNDVLIDNGIVYKLKTKSNLFFGTDFYDVPNGGSKSNPLTCSIYGSELVVTIPKDFISDDIYKGIGIFMTPMAHLYECELSDDSSAVGSIINGRYITSDNNVVGYSGYAPIRRSDDAIIDELMSQNFYLVEEFSGSIKRGSYKLSLKNKEKGYLNNLYHNEKLPSTAFSRMTYLPQVSFMYNSKFHIANYKSKQYNGYSIDSFHLSNHSVNLKEDSYAVGGMLPNLADGENLQYDREKMYFAESSEAHHSDAEIAGYITMAKAQGTFFASITTTIETQQGIQKVVRYIEPYDSNYRYAGEQDLPATFIESLGALLSFPDYRATEMLVEIVRLRENSVTKYYKTFKLKPHNFINVAYYINKELKPNRVYDFNRTEIKLSDFMNGIGNINDFKVRLEQNNFEYYPNGLKVSMDNNPFVFPYENTYQVGSSEIVALMSNTVAVGTGQTGAAPLYVFCKDGIYSLMVDSSGEMTYTNARIIARDVCNNANSVTPIDSGVVFTTDRGLMSIAGSEVVEIGSAVEGDVFDITDTSDKAKKIMFNAFTMQQLAEFPQTLVDNTDFLTYLKGSIVNYNHNERELMVSNPDKDYTYVMDRNGNWGRRAFNAQEYVNNYPTSYRIDKAGNFYKVDADDNDANQVYLLSNVIKLGTIAFKQAYRLVVRGFFKELAIPPQFAIDSYKDSKYLTEEEGKGYYLTTIAEYKEASQNFKYNIHIDSISVISRYWYKDEFAGYYPPYINECELVVKNFDGDLLYTADLNEVGYDDLSFEINLHKGNGIRIMLRIKPFYPDDAYYYQTDISIGDVVFSTIKKESFIGCYTFGSYDGRKWALLGGNEKRGEFTDIGCKISHTDVKYLRLCLTGKLSKDSRIDYIEVSSDGSVLNGKLR